MCLGLHIHHKSVVLGQTKILVSMFSGKDNCVFLRNVTRCYAKNIIVQIFSIVLPSYYHRITIALPSYTNACVIQAICLVGVNSYLVTSKIFRFTGPLRKGLKSSTFALTFVSDGHTNAMRSDEDSLRSVEDSLRRYRALLGSTKHRNNSNQFLSYPEKSRF